MTIKISHTHLSKYIIKHVITTSTHHIMIKMKKGGVKELDLNLISMWTIRSKYSFVIVEPRTNPRTQTKPSVDCLTPSKENLGFRTISRWRFNWKTELSSYGCVAGASASSNGGGSLRMDQISDGSDVFQREFVGNSFSAVPPLFFFLSQSLLCFLLSLSKSLSLNFFFVFSIFLLRSLSHWCVWCCVYWCVFFLPNSSIFFICVCRLCVSVCGCESDGGEWSLCVSGIMNICVRLLPFQWVFVPLPPFCDVMCVYCVCSPEKKWTSSSLMVRVVCEYIPLWALASICYLWGVCIVYVRVFHP